MLRFVMPKVDDQAVLAQVFYGTKYTLVNGKVCLSAWGNKSLAGD